MNFADTFELLEVLNKYIDKENINIQTEIKDWKGKTLHHDFLSADNDNVRIEVADDGIIIGYFTDHDHFDDLTAELQAGEPNYLERAKSFIDELFTNKIKQVNFYRKDELVKDSYYFITENNAQEEFIGGTYYKICLFGRKRITKSETIWQYDKEKQCFVKCATDK